MVKTSRKRKLGQATRKGACAALAALLAFTMSALPGNTAVAYAQGLTTQATSEEEEESIDLQQTKATNTSVTLTWNVLDGMVKQAITYTATVGSTTIATADYLDIDATATSYTITGLKKNVEITFGIYQYDDAEKSDVGYADHDYLSSVKTLSSTMGSLSYYMPFDKGHFSSYKLSVACTRVQNANADGYQAVLYTKAGKKVQTVTLSYYTSYVTFSKAKLTQCYKVRVRPYVELDGTTTKAYGAWTSYFKAVPCAKTKQFTNATAGKKKMKVKWSKVTGASKYIVYVARSKSYTSDTSGLSFKKVATVSGKKTSCTVKKVNKKKVNTEKYYYYVKIVTVSKYGSKTVKSKGTSAEICHRA